MQKHVFAAFVLSAISAGPALSHVVLDPPKADAGAAYRAVLRIGHGCGGEATHTLRVQFPDGFYDAKPMPKAGWALETVKGAYAAPYGNQDPPKTEGTREVIWSGGDLQDDWFDEFTIRGTVGPEVAPGTVLYFPTVQECANGKEEWTDISGVRGVPNPAPHLTVTAKADSGGHDAPVRLGDLVLTQGFSRATAPSAPVAGGFLTITNEGGDDRLIQASSDIAGRSEIHEMELQGDVMKMRHLPDGLPIPAGATVILKPGGSHLMFMDLKHPLAEGEVINVTLNFEKAGEVTVPLAVGPMNAGAGKGDEHAGH